LGPWIGKRGAEQIMNDFKLDYCQKERFAKSVASVQEMVDKLYKANFFK